LEFALLASNTLTDLADAVYRTDRWCLSATNEDALLAEQAPGLGFRV
jgi:hypothetical protein